MKKKCNIEPIAEINLIRFLIYNPSYRSEVFSCLKHNMFKSELCSEVFQTISNYYERFNKFPIDNIEILILNNEFNQDKKIIDEKLGIVRCDKNQYEIEDIEPFLKKTEVWWKQRSFALMTLDCATQYKNIEKNGFNASAIQEQLQSIQTFQFGKDDILDWNDDIALEEIYEDPDIRQRFNSNIWNKSTGGGIPKKCLLVVMGASGAGKSRLLHSLACDHMRENSKNIVLYFALEMTKKDMAQRTEANFFNMPVYATKKLYKNNKEEWKKRRNRFGKKYGKIIIDDRSDHTPATIRAKVETMIQKDQKPTMIIVDYLGLVNANAENSYQKGSIITKSLLSISKDFEIPVLAAAQPTREGVKNMKSGKGTDQTTVGESKAIYDDADLFITLNMTDEERENNRQRITIIKNRHHNKIETIVGELHSDIFKIDFLEFDNESNNSNDEVYNSEDSSSKFDNVNLDLPF